MARARAVAVASILFVVGTQSVAAQELSRYREYALGSTVASVVTLSGARESGRRTLHDRPALIQELTWRAPYVGVDSETSDPVRDVVFSFVDDQLYQVVVTYDRDRTEGLTNDDLIDTISATYGVPVLRYAKAGGTAAGAEYQDSTVVATWENATSLLTLARGSFSPQFQLVLTSKALETRARNAIAEAARLDTQEAPQREADQRKKEVSDAHAAGQKARVVNKPAFRP